METSSQKRALSQRLVDWMPGMFAGWLILTLFAPHQDLYKAFFHLLVIPALLVLLFQRRTPINWRDPFLLTALAYAAYVSIATFIVGLGPLEDHIRAFRWGVEISFGLMAFFIWLPNLVRRPEWWGRLFLWLVMLGALASIVFHFFKAGGTGRLTGLGAMSNPIIGSSILIAYFALGQFMLSRALPRWGMSEYALAAAALLAVTMSVLLSQSRGPIGALFAYLLFLAALHLPRIRLKHCLTMLLACALGLAFMTWLLDLDHYIAGLLDRGLSYRLDIWMGLIEHPPQSWWWGFGAGTDLMLTPAAEHVWEPMNFSVSHAHNLFLGALTDTGIIGLTFLVSLFAMVIRSTIAQNAPVTEKLGLLGLVALVIMLTFTGGNTLISSIKGIWLFAWLPLLFVWFWSRAGRDGAHQ